MDYDVEMLKLYFKEMGYTKEEIDHLLNTNPFNYKYMNWENQKQRDNKTLACILKEKGIVKRNEIIQEISIHCDNSIGRYLSNNVNQHICSINDNISKIKLTKGTIFIKDLYKDENYFLKKLSLQKTPFILGICTKNNDYYKKVKDFYKNLSNELKLYILEERTNYNQNICIVKTK